MQYKLAKKSFCYYQRLMSIKEKNRRSNCTHPIESYENQSCYNNCTKKSYYRIEKKNTTPSPLTYTLKGKFILVILKLQNS